MLFNFTLKTDDDCFVNVDEILKVSFTAILFVCFGGGRFLSQFFPDQ